MWKTKTRFRIVGVEVVGLGAYNLLILLLQMWESHALSITGFGWDYAVVGATLVMVGLELLALIKKLPAEG